MQAAGESSQAMMSLVNFVIRPMRAEYSLSDLWSANQLVNGKKAERLDFQIPNKDGKKMECSYYHFADDANSYPCVIYLHGNASCRYEGATHAKNLLSKNITLLAFDFVGCGHSEGDYISLGYFEQDDLLAIIHYMKKTFPISKFALYGRSMGAATALLYCSKYKNQDISGIVLDSSFSKCSETITNLGTQMGIPEFMVIGLYKFIQTKILEMQKFDVDLLNPIDNIKECQVPALFIHGKNDNIVAYKHSEILHAAYPGKKEFLSFDGDHNDIRPPMVSSKIMNFLMDVLN